MSGSFYDVDLEKVSIVREDIDGHPKWILLDVDGASLRGLCDSEKEAIEWLREAKRIRAGTGEKQ